MKIVVEARIWDEEYNGTKPEHIKTYKQRKSAIKRAKKESKKRDCEVDVRVLNEHYELKQHKIYNDGECVHSISQ